MRKVVRTPDFPIVDTPSGKLHGFLDNDVCHFYGIRYAIAGRFEMPRPVPAWKGVKDAKAYGYICPLLPEDPHAEGDPNGAPENSFEMPHVYWPMSENCQYLNVWTRHINEPANRPVQRHLSMILWVLCRTEIIRLKNFHARKMRSMCLLTTPLPFQEIITP